MHAEDAGRLRDAEEGVRLEFRHGRLVVDRPALHQGEWSFW